MLNQRLNRDKARAGAGQPDEARQRLRDHHQLAHDFAIIFPAHIENQADALIGDERKRVGGIQRLRR